MLTFRSDASELNQDLRFSAVGPSEPPPWVAHSGEGIEAVATELHPGLVVLVCAICYATMAFGVGSFFVTASQFCREVPQALALMAIFWPVAVPIALAVVLGHKLALLLGFKDE